MKQGKKKKRQIGSRFNNEGRGKRKGPVSHLEKKKGEEGIRGGNDLKSFTNRGKKTMQFEFAEREKEGKGFPEKNVRGALKNASFFILEGETTLPSDGKERKGNAYSKRTEKGTPTPRGKKCWSWWMQKRKGR